MLLLNQIALQHTSFYADLMCTGQSFHQTRFKCGFSNSFVVFSIPCLYVWHILLFFDSFLILDISVSFSFPKMEEISANTLEWWAAAGRRPRVSLSVHSICMSVCWCQYSRVCLLVYMLYSVHHRNIRIKLHQNAWCFMHGVMFL